MATPIESPSTSLATPRDLVKQLGEAETCFRQSGFKHAYSKCYEIIRSQSFDSLKLQQQYEVVKAYIKYGSCAHKTNEVHDWLLGQGRTLEYHHLCACEWVTTEVRQYQSNGGPVTTVPGITIRKCKMLLEPCIEEAKTHTNARDATAVLDVVVPLLVLSVLPHREVKECRALLKDLRPKLSPDVVTRLEVAIKDRIAKMASEQNTRSEAQALSNVRPRPATRDLRIPDWIAAAGRNILCFKQSLMNGLNRAMENPFYRQSLGSLALAAVLALAYKYKEQVTIATPHDEVSMNAV